MIDSICRTGDFARSFETMAPLLVEEYRHLGFHLSEEELLKKYQLYNKNQWTCFGRIGGDKAELNYKKAQLKKQFRSIGRIQLYTESSLQRVMRLAKLFRQWDLYCHLRASEPLRNLSGGIPTDAALKLTTWRSNRNAVSSFDVDLSSRGFLLVVPLCPFQGHHIQNLLEITRSETRKFEVDLGVTLNTLSESVIEGVISLQYENPQQGHACLEQLYSQYRLHGYWPYRLDIESMRWMIEKQNPFWKIAVELKSVFDPNHILSPGRYVPEI